jgi:hypothetical protein
MQLIMADSHIVHHRYKCFRKILFKVFLKVATWWQTLVIKKLLQQNKIIKNRFSLYKIKSREDHVSYSFFFLLVVKPSKPNYLFLGEVDS